MRPRLALPRSLRSSSARDAGSVLTGTTLVGLLLSTPAFAQTPTPSTPPPTSTSPASVPPAANGAPAGVRKLTVNEAVKLATENNPSLQAAHSREDATVASANSLRGRFLPTVSVSEEYQHYANEFAISFPLGPPGSPAPKFVARNQDVNTFVVAAGQPVLGLTHLFADHAALEAQADAATEQILSVESTVREAVETNYLRYFEALATAEIAKTSVQQLDEQRQVTQVKVKAGVLTNADALRLEVAAANAKQQEILARAQANIVRSALLIAMGFSPDENGIDFVEPTELENVVVPSIPEGDAQRQAVANRHETAASLHLSESADQTARSRFWQLWPEVNLEAAYINLHGEVLAPAEDEYFGVKATWNVFEWGASWYAKQAADAQADAAHRAVEDQSRQVRVDASSKLYQAQAAESAVASAQAAIASAEESYRVSSELVRVGTATTTTELLDAQTALTQAKLNLVRARYEQAIAIVSLKRAVGG